MRFLFFYPEMRVGGAQLLFARLAQSLVGRGHSVRVVDYEGGYVSRTLRSWNVRCEYESWERGNQIETSDDELFVLPISDFVSNARIFKRSSMKILLWGIHPNGVLGFAPIPQLMTRLPPNYWSIAFRFLFPTSFKRLKRLFDYLHSNSSLMFMENDNYEYVRGLGVLNQSAPVYVPIPGPSQVDRTVKASRVLPNDRIHLAWLGRLDSDKLTALNLATDISNSIAAAKSKPVTMHVIGNGDLEAMLRKTFGSSINPHFEFHGPLEGEVLHQFVRDNIAIGFAMGTSALEFGGCNVATVLLDWSKRKMPLKTYRFHWLHEASNFNIGQPYSHLIVRDPKRHDICDLLDTVEEPEVYEDIGQKCGDYVRRNHDLEAVTDRFLHASQNANASWDIATSLWGKTIIPPDLIAKLMPRLSTKSEPRPT